MRVIRLPGEFPLDILLDEDDNTHVELDQVLRVLIRSNRRRAQIENQFRHQELDVFDVLTVNYDERTWILATHLRQIIHDNGHFSLNAARVADLFTAIEQCQRGGAPPIRKRRVPEPSSSSSEQEELPEPKVALEQLTR